MPGAAQVGEFELIARYFDRGGAATGRPYVILGVGDDGALLAPEPGRQLVVSTDTLVADVHFHADVAPDALGHKALAVNLSDLAAMGARPRAFTLSLALPRTDPAWLERFSAGLFALADAHGCVLVGGDTTRAPQVVLGLTVLGDVVPGRALRRDAARPGDDVWVSGTLGAPAHALACRRGSGIALPDAHRAQQRLQWPQPRVALGLALAGQGLAQAAIDVSDGLTGDLGHIAQRSGVAITIDVDALPLDPALAGLPAAQALRHALAGGDEYELAFTAAPAHRDALSALCATLDLPLTRIGRVAAPDAAGPGLRLAGAQADLLPEMPHAHEHFHARS